MRLFSKRPLLFALSVVAPSLCVAEGVVLDNGARISASVFVSGGHDNNVSLTSDNELSSTFFETEGTLGVELNPGVFEHTLDLSVNDRRYQDSKQDNFTDWSLSYLGHFEPTSRNRAFLLFSTKKLHQQRGLGYTRYLEIPLDAPLEYTLSDVEANYEYGSLAASGRLGIAVAYSDFSFDNFAEYTDRLSYNSPQIRGWFNYDVGAVTSLTFDLSYQNLSYDIVDPNGDRDATIIRALVGTVWSGLAKTTGKFKLGYEKRNFDDDIRTDYGGLAVDIGVIWKPRTYSTVDIELTRRTSESGFSDLIVDTTLNVGWEHAWSDVMATSIAYQFLNRDEQGIFDRSEKRNFIGVAYSRQLARWLTFNVEYGVTINRSNESVFDYDNQVIMLGFKGFI